MSLQVYPNSPSESRYGYIMEGSVVTLLVKQLVPLCCSLITAMQVLSLQVIIFVPFLSYDFSISVCAFLARKNVYPLVYGNLYYLFFGPANN